MYIIYCVWMGRSHAVQLKLQPILFLYEDTLACRRFEGVFIAEKNGKRGVRDRRRHVGRTRYLVSRPRPIFARVQDGASDRELRVFRSFSAIRTPSNRL